MPTVASTSPEARGADALADAKPETGTLRRYVKRGFDLVFGLLLVIAALPLLVVISVMIALDSGWPVFYRQNRVGSRARRRRGGIHWEEQEFRILKFRTMVKDADAVPLHEDFVRSFVNGKVESPRSSRPDCKLPDDPRVTPVGRILRRTSLDELPQLFNVLRGSMSLVGPRPVPRYEVALYQPHHRERLAAVPGMTGLWQVAGRGRVSFEEMVRMDVDYVRRQSLWLDLTLLLRTVPAVFLTRGAK